MRKISIFFMCLWIYCCELALNFVKKTLKRCISTEACLTFYSSLVFETLTWKLYTILAVRYNNNLINCTWLNVTTCAGVVPCWCPTLTHVIHQTPFQSEMWCYIELSHIFPVLVLQISVRWRHFMCIMNFQYIYKFKMIDIFRVLYFLHFRFITLSFVYELHIFLSEHVVFLIFMLRQKSSFCC
jgi:hypothetical protein